MPRPIIILHGWSDDSGSFTKLAKWLRSQNLPAMDLFLGDYISLHDEITLTDLGAALQRALLANEIPTTRHSFDLIVHSTGGLVALEYLRQACVKGSTRDASLTPVRNLCFLAPASFGSPLAAKGKSLIGRTLKGWSWDRLLQKPGRLGQTGQRVLDALELASPYSWQLGLDTLFDFKFPLFTWENVRPTIMVGSAPYDSIAKYTHERGSDGTVRVSTANLNAHHYKVDFASPNDPALDPVKRSGRPAAFAVFNRNHGDICSPDTNLDQAAEWQATLLRALSFSNARADYQKHVASCDQLTQQTFQQHAADPNFHEYMHVVFRVRDQFGDPIPDYVIDFYQPTGDPKDKVYGAIHQEILEKVTTNTRDASLRSFLFDITDLRAFLTAKPSALVNMSVAAAPISADIFYHNPSATAPGVPIFRNDSPDFVHPNEPVLVDITLHRTGSPRVFKLSKA